VEIEEHLPVADKVSVTSVDEDRDLLKKTWNKSVERLHPVTLEEEISVNVKVAAVVARDLGTESLHDFLLVEVLAYPVKLVVAEAVAATLLAHIVWVHAGLLVWANDRIVAVDGSWNARPDALAVVAVLDEGLAAWESVVHGLALLLVENSWPSTVTAGHWAVVVVLGVAIGKTVTNEDGLQVDVALLVGENLGSKDWDVVTGVRLTSNVESLLGVLWELLEEQGHQSIDVLASCDSVADGAARVGVTDVDWLVKEDDRGIGVPRAWVVDNLALLVDR